MTLRALREQAEWTQDQLAAVSGLDQTTISHLELGKIQYPRRTTIAALARAFKTSPQIISEAILESETAA